MLALFLLAALPLSCRAEEINGVDVSGFTGDYDKFKGQNITINVYNWGEYISCLLYTSGSLLPLRSISASRAI